MLWPAFYLLDMFLAFVKPCPAFATYHTTGVEVTSIPYPEPELTTIETSERPFPSTVLPFGHSTTP